jgi:hypothetical protein
MIDGERARTERQREETGCTGCDEDLGALLHGTSPVVGGSAWVYANRSIN